MSRITSVAANGTVRFTDGAEAHDVHSIILATGYEWRVPFLTVGGMLDEIPDGTNASSHRLTTNSRYLRPVYERTLSLDPSYPLVTFPVKPRIDVRLTVADRVLYTSMAS